MRIDEAHRQLTSGSGRAAAQAEPRRCPRRCPACSGTHPASNEYERTRGPCSCTIHLGALGCAPHPLARSGATRDARQQPPHRAQSLPQPWRMRLCALMQQALLLASARVAAPTCARAALPAGAA